MNLKLLILEYSPTSWDDEWKYIIEGMCVRLSTYFDCPVFTDNPIPTPTMRRTTENVYDTLTLYHFALAHHLENGGRQGRFNIACRFPPEKYKDGVAIFTWEGTTGFWAPAKQSERLKVAQKFRADPPLGRIMNLLTLLQQGHG